MFFDVALGTQNAKSHYIETQQPSMEDIIRNLNAEELLIFNEELEVDPQQLFVAIQEPNTSNNSDALILFLF